MATRDNVAIWLLEMVQTQASCISLSTLYTTYRTEYSLAVPAHSEDVDNSPCPVDLCADLTALEIRPTRDVVMSWTRGGLGGQDRGRSILYKSARVLLPVELVGRGS